MSAKDVNYDDVGMDMSSDEGEGSEVEQPPPGAKDLRSKLDERHRDKAERNESEDLFSSGADFEAYQKRFGGGASSKASADSHGNFNLMNQKPKEPTSEYGGGGPSSSSKRGETSEYGGGSSEYGGGGSSEYGGGGGRSEYGGFEPPVPKAGKPSAKLKELVKSKWENEEDERSPSPPTLANAKLLKQKAEAAKKDQQQPAASTFSAAVEDEQNRRSSSIEESGRRREHSGERDDRRDHHRRGGERHHHRSSRDYDRDHHHRGHRRDHREHRHEGERRHRDYRDGERGHRERSPRDRGHRSHHRDERRGDYHHRDRDHHRDRPPRGGGRGGRDDYYNRGGDDYYMSSAERQEEHDRQRNRKLVSLGIMTEQEVRDIQTSKAQRTAAELTANHEDAVEDTFAKVKEATGVDLPKYYNPTAINPMKYAEQIKKRKMLWGKGGVGGEAEGGEDEQAQREQEEQAEEQQRQEREAAEVERKRKEEQEKQAAQVGPQQPQPKMSFNKWEETNFGDSAANEKFRRLMGMKGGAAAAPKPSSSSSKPSSSSNLSSAAARDNKAMFSDQEQQYERARMATHMQKGLGLGFGSMSHHAEPAAPPPGVGSISGKPYGVGSISGKPFGAPPMQPGRGGPMSSGRPSFGAGTSDGQSRPSGGLNFVKKSS